MEGADTRLRGLADFTEAAALKTGAPLVLTGAAGSEARSAVEQRIAVRNIPQSANGALVFMAVD